MNGKLEVQGAPGYPINHSVALIPFLIPSSTHPKTACKAPPVGNVAEVAAMAAVIVVTVVVVVVVVTLGGGRRRGGRRVCLRTMAIDRLHASRSSDNSGSTSWQL